MTKVSVRIPVKLDKFGRVHIPKSIQKAINAKEGDTLVIEIKEVLKPGESSSEQILEIYCQDGCPKGAQTRRDLALLHYLFIVHKIQRVCEAGEGIMNNNEC